MRLEAQRVDQLVQEALGREIQHARVGVAAQDLVRDRVHQVRLAETDAAVEEERVVGAGGRFGHGARRGVGELVGGADDEGLEGEARVQDQAAAGAGAGAARARRQPGPARRRGLEADREPGKSRRRRLPREQLAVPRLDPVGEDAGGDRRRSGPGARDRRRRRPGASGRTRSSAPWGRACPRGCLRIERPDLGHRLSPDFRKLFHSCGKLLARRGRGVYSRLRSPGIDATASSLTSPPPRP